MEEITSTQPQSLPRREFIRKSLLASGGAFIGMVTGPKLSLPQTNPSGMPMRPASRSKCDNRRGRNRNCPPGLSDNSGEGSDD